MKILLVLIVFVGSGVWATPNNSTKNLHPATGLSFVDFVKYFGYPIEVYENIQTEDGYLLTMHRIPHGKNNADQPKKGVVLLVHCLTCSATIYTMYGPEKGLAFILADQGYDVWMPNARGTEFSRKHISMNPDDKTGAFWRFSWHEIAYYDLPASIEVVKENTGVEKMMYVGFSQGTTTFTVLAATRPEYNDLFSLSVLLAPGTYFANIKNSFLLLLAKHLDPLMELVKDIMWFEFLPNYHLFDALAVFCNGFGQEFCTEFFLTFLGVSPDQLEQSWLPVFATFIPSGCSANQLIHYGQLIVSKKFQQYDYGLEENLAEYGTPTPPEYDVSKITTPVAIFYGANDEIITDDVENFAADLPNLIHLQLVDDPMFNHIDFILNANVIELVYNDVLALMSKYV
ncbi:lipase 3-like [Onthophagus taurus]|uniref:lipase 3-like n=1 Tax=Onthophagus taurus TaxID=166361 RepID=UPI000C208BDB|nr:lipase 3-like [Onthophagus taurus]